MTAQRSSWRRHILPCAVAVVAVVALGLGVVAANRPGKEDVDTAWVDGPASVALTHTVTDMVPRVFGFTPDTASETRSVARSNLVAAAVGEYERLYGSLLRDAPEQGLVLRTVVRAVGIESLTGDSARVLVFADQQVSRRANTQSARGAAQIELALRRLDGDWKISGITVL